MNIKRVLAGGLAALMAGSTLAIGGFSQASSGTGLASGVAVIGVNADAGAQLAALAALQSQTAVVGALNTQAPVSADWTQSTTTVKTGGTTYDTQLTLATSTSGTALSLLPSTGVLGSSQYSGLKDGKITWRGTDYSYKEEVDVANLGFRHGLSVSKVNGTAKLVVEDSDVIYKFTFQSAINLSSAPAGVGTISSPEYSNPINVNLLGQPFKIVGIDATNLKILTGVAGTVTNSQKVDFAGFSFTADQGSNNAWARVVVKDKDGKQVDSVTLNVNDVKTTAAKNPTTSKPLDVKVTAVRALQDGSVSGVDLVVGDQGQTERTYDTSADVGSDPSDRFPGTTTWGIRYTPASGAANGYIPASSRIDIVYKPTDTIYLDKGEAVSLPNDYATLSNEGYNTANFATITVKPVTSKTVYNSTGGTFGSWNGLEFASSVPNSILDVGSNTYDKVYLLFNKSQGANLNWTVAQGEYDNTKGYILVNDSMAASGCGQPYNISDARYSCITFADDSTLGANGKQAQYLWGSYKLNYGNTGEQTYAVTFNVSNSTASAAPIIKNFTVGINGGLQGLNVTWTNKTESTTSSPSEFRLGWSTTTSEDNEVTALSEGAWTNVGKQSNPNGRSILTDSGVLIDDPNGNGAADTLVIKVPQKATKYNAFFGKKADSTTGTTQVVRFTKPGQLKTGVDPALNTSKTVASHLVLVGGPCANALVQNLVDSGKLDAKYTCAGGTPGAGWNGSVALIKVVKDPFATGQAALVVAGSTATETLAAANAALSGKTDYMGVASGL